MTYTHHTKLVLVEGGNIFKQGDHPTLKFIAYDSLGNEVDLTNKQIEGALYSRNKGIMYEAPASFTDGLIVFTIDELLDNGKFQLEFTVTDSADPDYRAKFPSDEYAAQLTIKPSKDNMDFVGVSMTTVAQLKGELQGLQNEFAGQVLPRVDIVEDKQIQLEADYQAAAGALTEDSEVILARKGEPTLRAFNDKVVAQLAETANQVFWIKNPPAPLVGCKCDGVTDDSIAFKNLNDFLAANGGGTMRLPRSTKEITILNQEIELNSNVEIKGYGWNSKIQCTVGSSGNGNNILKAFEKENISLSKFTIENMGFGKSGAWEPFGTFEGAGACILAVGCENFVTDRVIALRGGGMNGGEGVGNIYYSCCKNSKIINNYVKYSDNGICVDSWYNHIVGKELFINDGVVIQGNTVTNGGGRGIVIENRSNSLEKGSIAVVGNTINKMAYAGIQGNNIFNCTITGNTIDGDQTGRNYGNQNDYMWYGMEFVSGSKQANISGNTIKKCKFNGIRALEAQDLSIVNNNIKEVMDFAIFVKNKNDDMFNVKVDMNPIDAINSGIFVGKEVGTGVSLKGNTCNNNVVKFNRVGGSVGIDFQNQHLGKCDDNIATPAVTYGGSIGIRTENPVKCTLNGNTLSGASKGMAIYNDVDSIANDNIVEACSSAFLLDGVTRTQIDSKIRGGSIAFDMLNPKTSTSQKARSRSVITDTPTVKNGNGIIVTHRAGAKPTTNVCDVGDRVENDAPTAGGYLGWTCVAQNSANWKGYGLIEA